MTTNRHSDSDRVPETATRPIHDHWILFVVEGAALILLGLLAIVIPSIASANVTVVLGWLFLAQRSHRVGDNLLGATGTRILVVPGIGFARDCCRCSPDREQIAGSVWRSDRMAIRESRPAAPDIGSVLPSRRGRIHHVRVRTPTSVLRALGLDVGERRRRHCLGEHHYFRSSGDLCLDHGAPGRDQHDSRWRRTDRDGIACSRRTRRFACNSTARRIIRGMSVDLNQ